MKVVIAGCGKVGATIAEQLSAEKHDVSVIDSKLEVVNNITARFDVMGVVGNAASYAIQKEAGVETADILIAVTDSDEVNLLCCLIAKKAGGCRTIARVRDPLYHREIPFIKDELGLSMAINPEQTAAREIARILRFPGAINIETFARGRIELTEFIVPAGNVICGMSVMDIRKKVQSALLICAVERDGEVIIPNGRFVLKENDVINFVASPADARLFFKTIGIETQKIRKAMIIGGGTICYYLTRLLQAAGVSVKIIERDRERCGELNELLSNVTVINGDATQQEVLVEEGVKDTDAFITLTGLDEANIFLSLSARDLNKDCKVVTKANKLTFEDIIGKFNIGSMIYPRYMTAEHIVQFVRAMQNGMGSNVETLYRIVRNKVEALEFIIREDSPVKDIPILKMPLRDNLLIAAVSRGNEIIYPDGQTELKVGDRVVVVTTEKGIIDIKDILK